ncbi:MAG: hypothetical protein U1E22_03635 [Coriobacteriia bacterium]|nr:hypothetical protein [Coriobacteriia bacterium]
MHSRKRRRKIIIIVLLLLLIALLAVMFINYQATRRLGLSIDINPDEVLGPPEYLFSFTGPTSDPLQRPLGVLVDGQRVYVTDSRRSAVDVFDLSGKRIASWTNEKMTTPLYIAKNPKDGRIYVSDRRTRSIHIFDTSGKLIGDFDPKLPKDQRPTFTKEVQWAPVAFAFADDGSLFVSEILKGHRVLGFDPGGKFLWSVGNVGVVNSATEAPKVFQFPNGLKIRKNEVWIADSNNRRIQVLDKKGEFLRIFPTDGLPRGFEFLRGDSQSDEGTKTARFAVVDTLSHDVTIWSAAGQRVLAFGQGGVLEGQFSYPNDISMAESGRMYVADTANKRVQVWGWIAQEQPIPTPKTPMEWALCFSPLLLLLWPLLNRKREFYAKPDFVISVFEVEEAEMLPHRRRRWTVLAEDFEEIRELVDGDIKAEELFTETEYSESDAKSIMDRLDVDHETASILAAARRAKIFCTEDTELRRLAKYLELDVVNHEEFRERFASKKDETTPS